MVRGFVFFSSLGVIETPPSRAKTAATAPATPTPGTASLFVDPPPIPELLGSAGGQFL